MAYWALEALDGSKTALSSLDRVEGTDPPAYKLGRRPHEESHFGTLPICVSRNQAQLTPCHDGVAIRHSGSAPTGVLRHHGAFDSNEDVGQWVWLTQEMGSTVIRHGDTIALTRGVNATAIQPQLVPTTVMFRLKWVCTKEALIERVKEMRDLAHNEQGNKKVYHLGRLAFDYLTSDPGFFFLGGNAMAATPLCAPALATPKTNRRRTAVRPRRPPRPPAPAA